MRIPLTEIFKQYKPRESIRPYTCIGQVEEIRRKMGELRTLFPGIHKSFFVTSCEDALLEAWNYRILNYRTHFEYPVWRHVVLVSHILVEERPGVLICDPGHDVGRLVTVMRDEEFPHTGWFLHRYTLNHDVEVSYTFHASKPHYVIFRARTLITPKNPRQYTRRALIYIGRPFLNPYEVTMRRSAVKPSKGIIAREPSGEMKAGAFFSLGFNPRIQLVFHHDLHQLVEYTYPLKPFKDTDSLPIYVKGMVKKVNKQLNYPEGYLLTQLREVSKAIANRTFIGQLLEIDMDINNYHFRNRHLFMHSE